MDSLDPLPPLGDLLATMLDVETGDDPAVTLQALAADLPLELELVTGGDRVLAFGAAPPLQRIETSLHPMLHRIRFTLTCDDEEGGHGNRRDR